MRNANAPAVATTPTVAMPFVHIINAHPTTLSIKINMIDEQQTKKAPSLAETIEKLITSFALGIGT